MDLLPAELLDKILKEAGEHRRTLERIACVCQTWRELALPQIWAEVEVGIGGDVSESDMSDLYLDLWAANATHTRTLTIADSASSIDESPERLFIAFKACTQLTIFHYVNYGDHSNLSWMDFDFTHLYSLVLLCGNGFDLFHLSTMPALVHLHLDCENGGVNWPDIDGMVVTSPLLTHAIINDEVIGGGTVDALNALGPQLLHLTLTRVTPYLGEEYADSFLSAIKRCTGVVQVDLEMDVGPDFPFEFGVLRGLSPSVRLECLLLSLNWDEVEYANEGTLVGVMDLSACSELQELEISQTNELLALPDALVKICRKGGTQLTWNGEIIDTAPLLATVPATQ